MALHDFPTIPEYSSLTTSDGIKYNEGDIVTCHYAGFYKIIGFWDYDNVVGRIVPQVIVSQLFDSNGKKKSGLKSCIADSIKPAIQEINREIKRIKDESKQKIESLTKLKEILEHNDTK